MPKLEFTPEDIPISQNKQETLYQRWVDPELIKTGKKKYDDEVVESLKRKRGYWLIPRYELKIMMIAMSYLRNLLIKLLMNFRMIVLKN